MERIWNKHKQPLGSAQGKPNTPLKRKVFVGMSGGVDSSVTAALLARQGHDVTGVFMKNWTDASVLRRACSNWEQERADALRVALQLGIPFETWDFEAQYREKVMNYFFDEYAAGRTPNPDILCNKEIKFGVFLQRALTQGADYVATGHYARISQNDNGYHLVSACDAQKDQTYFLSALQKSDLRHILFPIGEYKKSEVRALAREFGLPTAEKPDSQGICFVGDVAIKEFLQRRLAQNPGNIVTTQGEVLGVHEGIAFYTIGQRKGMGVGGGLPYYVVDKQPATNTLVVARGNNNELLYTKEARVARMSWFIAPTFPFTCWARLRHQHALTPVEVHYGDDRTIELIFSTPQRAVTPGQTAALYKEYGEGSFEVLGSGVIV